MDKREIVLREHLPAKAMVPDAKCVIQFEWLLAMRYVVLCGLLLLPIEAFAAQVVVDSVGALDTAIRNAKTGDSITIADGTYMVSATFGCSASSDAEPIAVSAQHRGKAVFIANASIPVLFDVSGAKWIFDGLEIHGVAGYAFRFSGPSRKCSVLNSKIVDSGLGAVYADCRNHPFVACDEGTVAACEIYDTTPANPSACTHRAVEILNGLSWSVQGNSIHDLSLDTSACPGAMAYGVLLHGGTGISTFDSNLFVNVPIAISVGGASPAASCEDQGSVFTNNVVWRSGQTAIQLAQACGTNVVNNTTWASGTSAIDVAVAMTPPNVTNNVTDRDVQDVGGATHMGSANVVANAKDFLDGANGNLRLASGAPEIDTGVTVSTVVQDFDGVPRPQGKAYDVGAFERPPDGYTDGGLPLDQDMGYDLGFSHGVGGPDMSGGGVSAAGFGGSEGPPRTGCACDFGSASTSGLVVPCLIVLALFTYRRMSRTS